MHSRLVKLSKVLLYDYYNFNQRIYVHSESQERHNAPRPAELESCLPGRQMIQNTNCFRSINNYIDEAKFPLSHSWYLQ